MPLDPVDSSAHRALFDQGQLVDHFQVMRLLGRGGMGEVYLARDTRLGRKVALKVIHPDAIVSPEAVESFQLEAQAMARFSHPNIVTLYGVGEHLGSPYLALEYLDGENLRQRMREEHPGVRESLRIGLAIAEALSEAHANGILHRDLKPENILLPRDGRLRVVDFGLVKFVSREAERDPARPASRKLRGSPPYMAPEQWMGQESTGATDIWALGTILYELVTGSRPYPGSSAADLEPQVCGPGSVPRIEVTHEAPADLLDLIYRCLDKDPAARPPGTQVAETLERLLLRDRSRRSEEQSPFRGLLPFTERHTELFFGRDGEIASFLEHCREQPVLPVVGPSGAGKSSFVQAGVIPRLREQGRWIVLELRPGNKPFYELASRLIAGEATPAAESTPGVDLTQQTVDLGPRSKPGDSGLTTIPADRAAYLAQELCRSPLLLNLKLQQLADRDAARVLLFVDQLEELYTLVEDEEVHRPFMEAICSAADDPLGPTRVVFTVRDDFLVRVADGIEARQALRHLTVIRSPEPDALQEILTRPLEAVGYDYDDPGLVPEMVAAVGGEPACLPLLQFVTRMLWDRRDKQQRLLRRAVYESVGGVAGALAQHADGVLEVMTPSQVRMARQLLLRLVTAEGTRRVLARDQVLEGLGPDGEDVLTRLTHARLVTVRKSRGEEHVTAELELAHESLVHNWSQLARWIEESREERRLLAEIRQAAELWHRRGRREDEVWQDDALREATRTLERCPQNVPPIVTSFLDAGLGKERRLIRRRRIRTVFALASVIALLATIAAVAVVVALALARKELVAREKATEARGRLAEAQREGARAAFARGDMLEARARLRSALETQDSPLGRALWWQLRDEPLIWSKEVGSFVYDVAVSPDGKTIAAACHNRSIYLLDQNGLTVNILRGHKDQVLSLAFSPDGKHLASGSWSGEVWIRDLEGGATRRLKSHKAAVWSVAFSPDSRLLATVSRDGTLRLWNLASPAAASRVTRIVKTSSELRAVAFSPDGRTLATGGSDNTIRIWDAATGAPGGVLLGHTNRAFSLAFSPDGRHLASGSIDRTVRLWDLDRKEHRVLRQHATVVYGVAFSPDGRRLAFTDMESLVHVLDLTSGREEKVLRGHGDRAYQARFSPDGRRLYSGSMDGTVRCWDLSRSSRPTVERGHLSAVFGVAIDRDARRLATCGPDRTIRLWDLTTGAELEVLRGHTSVIHNVAFSPDGRHLASASMDQTVRLWDLATHTEEHVLIGHRSWVDCVAFTPDGKRLVSGGWDNTVRVWDPKTGALVRTIEGHRDRVRVVAISSNGKLLASGGLDGWIQLSDLATGTRLKQLRGQPGGVFGLALSPDGRLVSAGLDRTLRSWRLKDWRERVLTLPGRVYKIAFHPDGRRVGAPLSDGTARILDLSSGTSTVLRGHRSEVNIIRFTRDGRLAVTGSDDGTARLWDVDTGRPHWRAPVLLSSPPQIFTHIGWIRLDEPATDGWPLSTRWRRAIEQRALEGAEGKQLCIRTHDDRLEIWDRERDAPLSTVQVPGLRQVLSLARGGCVVLAGDRAQLYQSSGALRELAAGASAIALEGDEILVAAGRKVHLFDGSGRLMGRLPADLGVSAIARVGHRLVLGFEDGNIELAGGPGRALALKETPSRPVDRIIQGPPGTLIAGYSNGFLGIWQLDNGALLYSTRLHGPVVHLLLKGGRLYAATQLGDHLLLEVGVFQKSYCALMREVWSGLPVVWNGGVQRARPPAGHRCAGR